MGFDTTLLSWPALVRTRFYRGADWDALSQWLRLGFAGEQQIFNGLGSVLPGGGANWERTCLSGRARDVPNYLAGARDAMTLALTCLHKAVR